MDPNAVTPPPLPADPSRNVGCLLAAGIFFLPFVFVWFLLRRGHTTLAKALGFGWFALWVIGAVMGPAPDRSSSATSSSSGFTSSSSTSRTAEPAELPSTVTADDLFDAYEANEVAADRQYKGKALQVIGTVQGISSDFMDDAVVELKTSNQFMPVRATGDDDFNSAAASLSKGTRVVLLCKGGGEVVASPLLKDCTISR